ESESQRTRLAALAGSWIVLFRLMQMPPDLFSDMELSAKDPRSHCTTSSALGCSNPDHQLLICWYNPAAFVQPPLAPGQLFGHQFSDASGWRDPRPRPGGL